MNLKVSVIFILAILIPTSLLAYFGLLAVRSEKSIVEKNMMQKYKAMADIVDGQIRDAFGRAREEALADVPSWEALLNDQAAIFRDEVVIFNSKGQPLGGAIRSLEEAAYTKPVRQLPYTIAVYERHPIIWEQWEKRRKGLVLYVSLIAFSALAILAGSFYALHALSREWRFAQLKSEFVSHLSHDLRRPLTSIRMFSEMLKDGHIPSEEKKREYYKIISSESDKLTHLANNILDFSRIERGRIRYHFQPEDIGKVVRETVERFRTYMVEETRRIVLEVEACPLVTIDANAITQALMNLLFNAVKYSPDGKEIRVNLKNHKKDVVIEVMDEGTGIPLPEQKRIFRKFYRVPKADVDAIEGSGLGLTLVKYAVEAHKGKVSVESEEGKGSKFSIALPAG
jgi:signal transduction histidine kinase